MRFHIDWGKTFHAILPLQINLPQQNDAIADDSAMISALYEAHLSMEKMLAALAELREDESERALG